MNDLSLEDRLRTALREEAERAPLRRPEWSGSAASIRARSRRRLAVIGAVAAALPLVAGVAFVATRGGDERDPSRDVITDATTTTAPPTSTTSTTVVTPASRDLWVPLTEGTTITSVGRDDRVEDGPATSMSVWVRCGGCPQPTAAFAVQERSEGQDLQGLAQSADAVDLDADLGPTVSEARITREIAFLGGVTVLDVREGEDAGFVILGWGDEADLLAVARAQLGAAPPPEGLERVFFGAAKTDMSSVMPSSLASVTTTAMVRTADGTVMTVRATEGDEVPLAAGTAFLRGATPIDVNGLPGLVMNNGSNSVVVWKPDATTTITMNGLADREVAIAIAREVRKATEDEWRPSAGEALADVDTFDPANQPVLPDGTPDCRAFAAEGIEVIAAGTTGGGHRLCAVVDRTGGGWKQKIYLDGNVVASSEGGTCPSRAVSSSGRDIAKGGIVEPRGVNVDRYLSVGTAPVGATSVTLVGMDGSTTLVVDTVPALAPGEAPFYAAFAPTYVFPRPEPGASAPPC
jgi:hypothetical protein